jgi:RHS repeat-associated protein
MGSVIGMADNTGTSVARYTYDAFGNVLTATGTAAAAPAGAGGDFRFHGAWLDTVTGFYDMRARTYDSVTGRFLSRDPAQPDPQRPEEENPYIYALDNPTLYTDPTGQFEVIEVNISISVSDSLQAIQTVAIEEAKKRALAYVQQAVADALWSTLKALVPELEFIDYLASFASGLSKTKAGKNRQATIISNFATAIGLPNWLWLEVAMQEDGTPLNNGINVSQGVTVENIINAVETVIPIKGSSRPDFVLGDNAPLSYVTNGHNTSWIVGDIKSSVAGMAAVYLFGYKNDKRPLRQFNAIANYATSFCPGPIGLFICVKAGAPKTRLDGLLGLFVAKCLRARFAPIIVTLIGGTGRGEDPFV